MKEHRKMALISSIIVIIVFGIYASGLISCINGWTNDVLVGVFSSAIVLLVTSIVGYKIEEQKILSQYYWNLVILNKYILILSTPQFEEVAKEYYETLKKINELLIINFAQVDQSFCFYKLRKEIRQLLKINNILYNFYSETKNAEVCFRYYLGRHYNDDGKITYTSEKLRDDIKNLIKMTDDYDGTGKKFVIYLDKEIEEFRLLINKEKL